MILNILTKLEVDKYQGHILNTTVVKELSLKDGKNSLLKTEPVKFSHKACNLWNRTESLLPITFGNLNYLRLCHKFYELGVEVD